MQLRATRPSGIGTSSPSAPAKRRHAPTDWRRNLASGQHGNWQSHHFIDFETARLVVGYAVRWVRCAQADQRLLLLRPLSAQRIADRQIYWPSWLTLDT